MASTEEIPDKLYFRIGEASRLVGVKPHVLRYWEKEFAFIKPEKHSGQRLYRRREVELFRRIRQLLHEERYTIEGTRKRLQEELFSATKTPPDMRGCLLELKSKLLDLQTMIRTQYRRG
ncbi:MAG: MerR family transcriptional regulator [Deltaproteobacteria bacterium]|nr:MerR family transcriptional regulator [Deltaproteobacteria bacterium]